VTDPDYPPRELLAHQLGILSGRVRPESDDYYYDFNYGREAEERDEDE
jgi:hypothetical protein